MLTHPHAEFDIKARARWLTQLAAIATGQNFNQILDNIDREMVEEKLAPDSSTWFAMERVSRDTGLKAVKFIHPGQDLTGADLAWVSPFIDPNENDARRLAGVKVVVANEAWLEAIAKAAPARKRKATP